MTQALIPARVHPGNQMIFFPWLTVAVATVSCATVKNDAAGDESDLGFSSLELKAHLGMFESKDATEYFASYKIPLAFGGYHGADAELIGTLSEINSEAFHTSRIKTPIIRHERPGYMMMNDELHGVCAEFRAMKSSIDPSAYSKQEKFDFIEKISALGAFNDVEAMNDNAKVVKKNQRVDQVKERLAFRGVISATIMSSHFCRDALRLAASVLDASQIDWLLRHSTEAIVSNPELLDQLEDFSMFDGYHLELALMIGHYDWFKNQKALKTLKPAALLELFLALHYDLTPKQLESLNAVRPIQELFQTPEFLNDPFVWQVTAGSPHFRDDHINIEGLVEMIENSAEDNCSDDLKQAIFSLYVHSENSINAHINTILMLSNLHMASDATAVNVEGTVNMENIVLPPPLPLVPIDMPVDMPIMPSPSTLPLPLPSPQEMNAHLAQFHINGLEFVFKHRHRVLHALDTKYKDLEKLDGALKHLIGFFVTPTSFGVRSAVAVVAQVKSEFTSESSIEDLLKLVREAIHGPPSSFDRKVALILAYCEMKFSPLRMPYRHVPGTEAKSTAQIIEKMRNILMTEETVEESMILTKWPRMFFIQQAFDYKFSQSFQSTFENPLNMIFGGYLIFCDLDGFSEFDVAALKLNFPEESKGLVTSIEAQKSVEVQFEGFSREFYRLVEVYRELQSELKEINTFMQKMASMSRIECQLMALIQNRFKVEMVSYLSDFEDFSEFAYMLKRSQVAELLQNEEGRKFLSQNRAILYNLPTYEDFRAVDIKGLNLQAQYATMVRTLPVLPLLISLKTDEYVFNDPLGLSWRLFSNIYRLSAELLQSSWKIVSFQMLAEAWNTGSNVNNDNVIKIGRFSSLIQNYLTNSREVVGKPVEALKQILHWIILQELKFVEAFLMINSKAKSVKWQDALNVAILVNQPEQSDRDFILGKWLGTVAAQSRDVQTKLGPGFLQDMLEILGGPLSQLRGGAFLSSRTIMDQNARLVNFGEYFVGFYAWTGKMFEEVKLKPRKVEILKRTPVKTETFAVKDGKVTEETSVNSEGVTNTTATTTTTTTTTTAATADSPSVIVSDSENTTTVTITESNTIAASTMNTNGKGPTVLIVNPKAADDTSYTNIPQYRAHVEQDVLNRQKLMVKLLTELGDDPQLQLWIDRVKLLSMFSADGFTLSPGFEEFRLTTDLPLREAILYAQMRSFAGLDSSVTEFDELQRMATVIIQFARKDTTETTKSKKNKGNKRK